MTEITDTKTEKELVETMQALAVKSVGFVGIDKTIEALNFLGRLVETSPDLYKKLTQPETIKEINRLMVDMKEAGSMNPFTMMGYLPRIKKILD